MVGEEQTVTGNKSDTTYDGEATYSGGTDSMGMVDYLTDYATVNTDSIIPPDEPKIHDRIILDNPEE